MTGFMVRQGDVLVRQIAELPPGLAPAAAETGRLVLAHGEVTGHHHSIALSPRIAMFRDDGAGSGGSGGGRTVGGGNTVATLATAEDAAPLYLQVKDGPVQLEHQEHTALTIPPGVHEVRRQRVFTAGMAQRVAD